MISSQRFKGRIALITGAASGIGRATALRLASEGAKLALCDLSEEGLATVASATGLAGADVVTRVVDVANGNALEAFVQDAGAMLGGLDILINNAGMGSFGHVDETTAEQWHRTFAVNVDSIFFAVRAALPMLRERRGCIVNTASISGLLADPGLTAYCASKGAVVNLTRQLAVDHADDGIRVNCICPGAVSSPMLRGHMRDDSFMAEYERTVPMRRIGTPEEMAAAICFLASDDAAYITGTELVVDGGVTAQTGQPHFDRLYRARGWDKKFLGHNTERSGEGK